MDRAETRLRLQLWLYQSWPLRALSWWFERGVPRAQGFGKFRADCFDLRGTRPGEAMTDADVVAR
jgi:hypothetical protein